MTFSISTASRPALLGLAVVPPLLWAGNFVAVKLGFLFFGVFTLTALRFGLIALLLAVFGWPRVPGRLVFAYAVLCAGGQYTLSTYAVFAGLSAGLTSLIMQTNVFISAAIAWLVLRERIAATTAVGISVGFAGLVWLTLSAGQNATPTGLVTCFIAATCWSLSALLLRRMRGADAFSLQAAACAIALPVVTLAAWRLDAQPFIWEALAARPVTAALALLYTALISLLVGQGLWARLLGVLPISTVSPFALLVPAFGMLLAWSMLDEHFTPTQLAACAVVFAGLAVHFYGLARPRA